MGRPPSGKPLLATLAPLRLLWGPNFLLPALLIAALALRVYGIDWDDGHGFHPDERSFYLRADDMYRALTKTPGYETWVNQWPGMEPGIPDLKTAISAERSPLNPHWFPLGSILIYALVLIRSVVEVFTDWGAMDMRFAGRAMSALADVGSVWMMYVIGRRMYGGWTGILAAAFTTFAVIHIQHAHFYRPEPFTVLASLAALWAMLRFIDTRRSRDAVLLGALVGLAIAPKVSVAPILAPLTLTFLWVCKDRAGGRWRDLTVVAAIRLAPTVLLAVLAALLVFFVTTPYAFLDIGTFVEEIRAQAEMARSAGHWPFTWQYANTPAFLFQIRQTAVWGLGIPLGIVAWLAAAFTAWLAWRGGIAQRADLLLLAWAVPAFVFLELFEVKFLRYVFPLVPFYVLMAARMLIAAVNWSVEARRTSGWPRAVEPYDAPFSEEWHATPPTVGDDLVFDEPLFGDDAPFSEEWHATPPVAGVATQSTPPPGPIQFSPPLRRSFRERWKQYAQRHSCAASIPALAIILVATILYALAFVGIYSGPHTAVSASEWINANAPVGAAIVNGGSYWDEQLPNLGGYDVWTFPAFHPDDDRDKIPELVDRLAESDFVVFYSNRAYGAVSRLPDQYPQSSAFFRLLFSGDLGYRLEKAFTSYPALAGVQLRDDPFGRARLQEPVLSTSPGRPRRASVNLGYADENVVGYDHPQVLVFRNVDRQTAETLQGKIESAIPDPPPGTAPLMLSPSSRQAQRTSGAWAEVFKRDGWANRFPWLSWLLVIELISLVAFPCTWWLLRPLPDRGVLFARILGLLLVAWVTWILVSVGPLRFSTGLIWLAIIIVAAPSAVVLWRQWRMILDWVQEKWRFIVAAEVLFLLAYAAFVLIRAANPDLWHPWRGGEKPMELAYFTAVARSVVLPPYDPWFSGGYLNYYYWGYFILSIPARITAIPPAVAFNLAVPLLFALTATGMGGLVYNMVEAARRPGSRLPPEDSTGPPAPQPPTSPPRSAKSWHVAPFRWMSRLPVRSACVAGLVAAMMAVVAGNLDGTVQLFEMADAKIRGTSAPLSDFDFWRSSRAIPEIEEFETSRLTPWLDVRNHSETAFHITEFPFFTFLFADLHAHMTSMPFALLGLALGFSLLSGLTRRPLRTLWPWATAAALGLAVGSLWAINSWEYPAYALLMLGLVGAATWMHSGGLKSSMAMAATLGGAALLVSYLAFLPFHSDTETFGTGIEPTRWRTPLENYVLVHALPLLGGATLLTVTLPQAWRPLVRRMKYRARIPALHQWFVVAVVFGILAASYCCVAGFLTAGLLTILFTLTGWALATTLVSDGESPARRSDLMALCLLAMALAIGIGVDFVRVEGDIARMNTLFKYYLVAWLLFAASGAYGFWRGWTALSCGDFKLRRKLRWFALAAVGVVAAGVLVYPVLATPVRIADRFNPAPLTLDGEAWMPAAEYHPPDWCSDKLGNPIDLQWDYYAIRWLQEHAVGTPVVLEAHGSQYCWNSRFSQYTGLPTVIGWPWHQTQQRNDGEAVRRRAKDAATIYNTRSQGTALKLLDDYDVTYIVAGELERLYYPAGGIAKFDAMVRSGNLRLAYTNHGTNIYEVLKAATR